MQRDSGGQQKVLFTIPAETEPKGSRVSPTGAVCCFPRTVVPLWRPMASNTLAEWPEGR